MMFAAASLVGRVGTVSSSIARVAGLRDCPVQLLASRDREPFVYREVGLCAEHHDGLVQVTQFAMVREPLLSQRQFQCHGLVPKAKRKRTDHIQGQRWADQGCFLQDVTKCAAAGVQPAAGMGTGAMGAAAVPGAAVSFGHLVVDRQGCSPAAAA